MRWARRQPHIQCGTRKYGPKTGRTTVDNWWDNRQAAVAITHVTGAHATSVDITANRLGAEIVGGNAHQIIDTLAALGLLPTRMSRAYRTGQLHARAELTREISEAAQTYAVIERAGKDAWPGGE
jgi:sarcosine oxidase gamma subunit